MSWQVDSLAWAVFLSVIAMASSHCDNHAVCSVENETGCEDGLVCRFGADGRAGCFCSNAKQTGCPEGLECYEVEEGGHSCSCSVNHQTGCEDETLACERIPGHGTGCFPPVTISGGVFDLMTSAPIEGAYVMVQDPNNLALSKIAITDAKGRYVVRVQTPRTADGDLLNNVVKLRADAPGYLTFPSPPRVAPPVDVGLVTGDHLNVETSATNIWLIPLREAGESGTITGTIRADAPLGTLVVAGGERGSGGGMTGVADAEGRFTVFNVPAGTVSVKGYKVGVQLEPSTVEVFSGETAHGVDLQASDRRTSMVTGKVMNWNPGVRRHTSVILVVEETFSSTFAGGQTPPGLRAAAVEDDFVIEGVPEGDYVVLAASENDLLVRDPSTSDSSIVHIRVGADDVTIDQRFEVRGALSVISPDGEEVVTASRTFVWADDLDEEWYEIALFDAFGNLIWERTDIRGVYESAEISVPYEGPDLVPGMLYQFRVMSIRPTGAPFVTTEDLRGVFVAG